MFAKAATTAALALRFATFAQLSVSPSNGDRGDLADDLLDDVQEDGTANGDTGNGEVGAWQTPSFGWATMTESALALFGTNDFMRKAGVVAISLATFSWCLAIARESLRSNRILTTSIASFPNWRSEPSRGRCNSCSASDSEKPPPMIRVFVRRGDEKEEKEGVECRMFVEWSGTDLLIVEKISIPTIILKLLIGNRHRHPARFD